jgi:hypothetical protein
MEYGVLMLLLVMKLITKSQQSRRFVRLRSYVVNRLSRDSMCSMISLQGGTKANDTDVMKI